mmetsp:Transcript_23383/g.73199  ORF Transcript_23383/g.73199 Transcript_23383/m.73199 type:complete len:224 (-) Transcript_23383:3147-3818(-)
MSAPSKRGARSPPASRRRATPPSAVFMAAASTAQRCTAGRSFPVQKSRSSSHCELRGYMDPFSRARCRSTHAAPLIIAPAVPSWSTIMPSWLGCTTSTAMLEALRKARMHLPTGPASSVRTVLSPLAAGLSPPPLPPLSPPPLPPLAAGLSPPPLPPLSPPPLPPLAAGGEVSADAGAATVARATAGAPGVAACTAAESGAPAASGSVLRCTVKPSMARARMM